MGEALSRHADEAFALLPDNRYQEIAEKLFKALTEIGDDNREVRRPVTLRPDYQALVRCYRGRSPGPADQLAKEIIARPCQRSNLAQFIPCLTPQPIGA